MAPYSLCCVLLWPGPIVNRVPFGTPTDSFSLIPSRLTGIATAGVGVPVYCNTVWHYLFCLSISDGWASQPARVGFWNLITELESNSTSFQSNLCVCMSVCVCVYCVYCVWVAVYVSIFVMVYPNHTMCFDLCQICINICNSPYPLQCSSEHLYISVG